MLKQFLRDGLVYGVAGVLSRAISLLLLPIYTRFLTPADYGSVDMLTVFGTLVNLTVALEISQAVARFTPEARTQTEKIGYASASLWFTLAMYSVFTMVAFPFAPQLSQILLNTPEKAGIIRLALAYMYSYGIFYLAQNQLRWDLKPVKYAATSVAFTAFTFATASVLVGVMHLGLRGVVTAQMISAAASAVLALYLARDVYRISFPWHICREMLRFSMPLVPASMAVFVSLYIDRIAIKQLMSLSDVGIFGVGYRFASASSLLMVGVQGALMPLIYKHYREPDTPVQLARLFRLFVAGALLFCGALSIFGPELVAAFATPAYGRAAGVIPLLAPAVLLSTMYIFTPGLAIAKRTRAIAVLTIFGAVLNTTLNYTLIPLMGIRGAALSTFISAASVFAGYMVSSQRLYPVPHAWPRLAAGAVVTAIGTAAAFAIAPAGAVAWLVKPLLLAVLLLGFVKLRLIETHEMTSLRAALLRARRSKGSLHVEEPSGMVP